MNEEIHEDYAFDQLPEETVVRTATGEVLQVQASEGGNVLLAFGVSTPRRPKEADFPFVVIST